jgi:hypothetical protein
MTTILAAAGTAVVVLLAGNVTWTVFAHERPGRDEPRHCDCAAVGRLADSDTAV